MLILLSLLLLCLFIAIAVTKQKKVVEKEKQKPPKKSTAEPVKTQEKESLRRAFNQQEEKRRVIQAKEREAFINSIEKQPLKSELEIYRGRRTRKTVRRIGNGFEFMAISNTEDISRPGVYGIYAGSVLLYVGKSDRPIEDRLKEHVKSAKYPEQGGAQQQFLYEAMRKNKDIVEGRVLAYAFNDDPSEISQLEMSLIQSLDPICNISR